MDELAAWLDSAGGVPAGSWSAVDAPGLKAEFDRIMAERIPAPPRPELVVIERASNAVRVRYSGGASTAIGRDYEDDVWIREFVQDVAHAAADAYLALPPF